MFALTSSNPQLSYVLGKNPASGLSVTPVKAGILATWYSKHVPLTWCATFIDSPNKASFGTDGSPPESGDYLNVARYAALQLVQMVIGRYLDHLLSPHASRNKVEYDVKADQTLVLSPVWLPRFDPELHIRCAAMMGLELVVQPLPLPGRTATGPPLKSHLFQLTLRLPQGTVATLVQQLYLFTLLWDKSIPFHKVTVADEQIRKVAQVMNQVNPPFFMRKHILLHLVGTNEKATAQYGPQLAWPGLTFAAGTNAMIRQRFVEQQLHSLPVAITRLVDFGCGDHVNRQRRQLGMVEGDWKYIGVDADPLVRQKLAKFEGPQFMLSADLNLESEVAGQRTVVLATEVMEHISLDEGRTALRRILSWNPVAVILTTPNVEFNPFYGLPPGTFRHADHTHEFGRADWEAFLKQAVEDRPYTVCTSTTGDTVAPDVGCILTAVLLYQGQDLDKKGCKA